MVLQFAPVSVVGSWQHSSDIFVHDLVERIPPVCVKCTSYSQSWNTPINVGVCGIDR